MCMNYTDRIEGRKSSIIVVRGFNTPLSIMGTTNREKINKEIKNLSNTIRLNLTDIYRTLDPTAAGYTFFSHARRTFSRI